MTHTFVELLIFLNNYCALLITVNMNEFYIGFSQLVIIIYTTLTHNA